MTGIVTGHCPTWINEALLAKILEGGEETTDLNRVEIYHLKADPAVNKGENFASDLTRVSVKYTRGHKKGFKFAFWVLKSDLVNENNLDAMLDEYNVFNREIACYRNILPRVYALLRSIGDESKLSAVCYKIGETDKPRYLAFEDLKHSGYSNADRRLGLDVPLMKLAFVKLAKWHAATAHLARIDPTTMQNHQVRNISPEVKHFHPFFESAMRSGADVVKTWPGCELYGVKLHRLADSIIEKNCSVFTRDDNAFNVLTHGDMWMNNIMFKNDPQGQPMDAVLVDYAVGFHGSPGIDLGYLLFTSNAESSSEDDWDELLRVYHTELVTNLKKLGFTGVIPTLLDIYVEFLRKSYYGLMISIFIIPLRLIEDTKDADMAGLLGETPEKIYFRKMLFSAPKYRNFLEPLLKFWDRKGLLDA